MIHCRDGIEAVAEGNARPSDARIKRNLDFRMQDRLAGTITPDPRFAHGDRHAGRMERLLTRETPAPQTTTPRSTWAQVAKMRR